MKKKYKKNLFSLINIFFENLSSFLVFSKKKFKYLILIFFICILSIYKNHFLEKKIREMNGLKIKIEQLKVQYLSLESEYQYKSSLSQIEKRANKLDLFVSNCPNFIIK